MEICDYVFSERQEVNASAKEVVSKNIQSPPSDVAKHLRGWDMIRGCRMNFFLVDTLKYPGRFRVNRDVRACTESLKNQSAGGGGVLKIYKISRTTSRTIMEDGARLFATSLACDV